MTTTDDWLGGTGNFATAAKWSRGVPAATSDVLVDGGGLVQATAPFVINWFQLKGGSRLALTNAGASFASGSCIDSGILTLDGEAGSGGSSLAVGGALTSHGQIAIGNASLSSATTLTVGSLPGPRRILIIGGATTLASLDIGSAAGFGTVGTLTGNILLRGDARIRFADTGQITTIAFESELVLTGRSAFLTAAGLGTASNTALEGLTSVGGVVVLQSGARIATRGDLDIAPGGDVDLDLYDFGTGSSFAVAGVLTVGGALGIGDGSGASAASLVNTGRITLAGGKAGMGRLSVAGRIENDGSIALQSEAIALGPVTGTGTIDLAGESKLQLDANVSAGQTVVFDHAAGGDPDRLVLVAAAHFRGTIDGFRQTDAIDVGAFGDGARLHDVPDAGGGGGRLRIVSADGSARADILFDGTYAPTGFSLRTASDGDTIVGYAPSPNADNWSGGTGAWSDAAGWSAGVPVARSDVFVPEGTVSVGGPVVASSIDIAASATVDIEKAGLGRIARSVTIDDSNGAGALLVGAGASLQVGGAIVDDGVLRIGHAATLASDATATAASLSMPTDGYVASPGRLELDGGTTARATLALASAAGIGAAVTIHGTIALSGNALLEFAGARQITRLTGSLTLVGPDAFVADAGLGLTSSTALTS